MGVLLIVLVFLIPVAWFAGLFGLFYVTARGLQLRQPGLVALATLLLFVFASPPAINALTRVRVNEQLAVEVTNDDAKIGSTTLGIVRRMSEARCAGDCQSILFNRQADRVILASFDNSTEPDWSTPQASFVLGDCSDPADLTGRGALAPINVAKATGLCIHREADRPLSEAQHTILSGYFTRKHLIGPSIGIVTARYYVRDGREQRLVEHQTQVRAKYLKAPLMLAFDWRQVWVASSSRAEQITFWHRRQTLGNQAAYPEVSDMIRLAGLDPKRPLPIENSSIPEVLLEALAQNDRPQAQDDALYRIALSMVWKPGLTQANRTYVEAFIDTHPQALTDHFREKLEFNGYTDLNTRLNRRIPTELNTAVIEGNAPRAKTLLTMLERQPVHYRAAIFDELMTIFKTAKNRRSLRRLPPILAKVDGAGPAFVALLEQENGWPAVDRSSLAYGACKAGLDEATASRFEAVLRADLAADTEGIADIDVGVVVSGLAHTGVEPVDIAVLLDRYLVPLDTQLLMPANRRPVIGVEEETVLGINLSWIWHFANSGCQRPAS